MIFHDDDIPTNPMILEYRLDQQKQSIFESERHIESLRLTIESAQQELEEATQELAKEREYLSQLEAQSSNN